MATNTYVALDTQTVTSAVSSVTFSSISQAYTDLVIVANPKDTSSGPTAMTLRFNSDSGSNYSSTRILGDGTSASSARTTNAAQMELGNLQSSNFFSNTFQIQNYSNSTTYKTALGRTSLDGYVSAYVGLWRSTAAITSVTILASTTWVVGSTFTLYGIAKGAEVPTTAKATGGTIAYGIDYTYHTFTSSGTFTPTEELTVDYLVVAGGGGGGREDGGGGGAGGLRSTVDATGGGASLESALSLATSTGYTVTVGAGGASSTSGSNSVFSTITSIGGGRGSGDVVTSSEIGGSGGGGGGSTGTAPRVLGSAGTANQGFAGGDGTGAGSAPGGGGGGAGAVGVSAPSGSVGGDGGTGVAVSISGASVFYAGGGGGGKYNNAFAGPAGAGGAGGGGAGVSSGVGTAGTANTGGGGGGGAGTGSQLGGAGGSGIVIIRYANQEIRCQLIMYYQKR